MTEAQSGRVGRRLAAIVAADVAGYSRLMGLDEVGTARTLREHLAVTDAVVAKHGGRIVKTTGDGVLLEFSSVVDAVECAVAIQAVMTQRNEGIPEDRRMLFRIGINLGDILIEERDDILGDGVNIAARLEGIAEPGGICISSSAYEQVRGKVPVDFTDLGEQTLKNIARPIRAYAVGLNANYYTDRPARPFSSAPRLSIAVLPFANIGGDPEQEYFVDGVTESLTTDLSRISGSFVIARNTAFSFKGKAVDVKRVGRELNVRYLLEGSVQRVGNRLRVNVQLIDADTGNHLWAERFDKPVADFFDVQDEIISRLANALDAELIAAEARRAEHLPHPDAIDLVFQGKDWFNKGTTPGHMAQARRFFENAIALDPENVEAMVGTMRVDTMLGTGHMSANWSARLAAAETTSARVLSIAPNHAIAHGYLGFVQMHTKRVSLGIAECEHALVLDRNFAFAHSFIGFAKFLIGRASETELHIKEAFRLSPRDTFAFTWMLWLGVAKLQLNANTEGIAWLRKSLDANRNFSVGHFILAGALMRIAELEQAQAAVQAGLALDPSFTVHRLIDNVHSRGLSDPAYLAGVERIAEGMRLAGVPEG
jgi:TolB-like protein